MFRHNAQLSEALRYTRRAANLRKLELGCRERGMVGEACQLASEAAKAERRAETMLGFLSPQGENVE